MYRNRYSYWKHSKLAKHIQKMLGAPVSPKYATGEEWIEHDRELKTHKFAYWLDKTFWNKLQNFVYYPNDVYHHWSSKYRNRFVSKRYALFSELPKTEWMDWDGLMLHAVFDSFCNNYCLKEKGKGDELKLFLHWGWEKNLVWDEDSGTQKDSSSYGKPTSQALHAIKEQELYNWWKVRKIEIEKDDFVDFETEEKQHDLDNEKLKELIDIRRGCWT